MLSLRAVRDRQDCNGNRSRAGYFIDRDPSQERMDRHIVRERFIDHNSFSGLTADPKTFLEGGPVHLLRWPEVGSLHGFRIL